MPLESEANCLERTITTSVSIRGHRRLLHFMEIAPRKLVSVSYPHIAESTEFYAMSQLFSVCSVCFDGAYILRQSHFDIASQ